MSDVSLILTDEATLLPLTQALLAGWVTLPCPVTWLPAPAAETAAGTPGAITLAAPHAYVALAATHVVVADIAVASRFRGALALAGAQRPDALAHAQIDARDVTLTTATLARILGAQHFGAQGWQITREPAPGAAARLLEGDAALIALAAMAEVQAASPPADEAAPLDEEAELDAPILPGGHAEDLIRAWFVLTGLPWVSHVLLAERRLVTQHPEQLAAVVAALRESLRLGQEQAVMVRARAMERLALPASPIRQLFKDRTYRLGVEEGRSLNRYFQRAVRYAERPAAPEVVTVQIEA